MFFYDKRVQYHARSERPDPLYAKKLQEILGASMARSALPCSSFFRGGTAAGRLSIEI